MNVNVKVIEKLKLKDEEAFNEVYFSYYKLIYYIIFSMVKNSGVAEDLMQDAFIRMYDNIEKLDDAGKFHYWFIRLSKNITLNYLKKEKNLVELNDSMVADISDGVSDSLFPPVFEFNEFLDSFENYIITLKFVYDFSFQQISEETNKSMSIVTKSYYKALKKIKKHYKGRR